MNITFTGGGSLGPVTPLVAVMRSIEKQLPGAEFSWIGTEGGVEERVVRDAGVDFVSIRSGKLRRYFSFQNFTDLFRIVVGFFDARRVLSAGGTSVVVSAGGFVAVPVVWAARSLGIPVHVHQQDVVPGLANRLSLPVASSVSVALQSSLKDFSRSNPSWTGNPVRPEVFVGDPEEAIRAFGLRSGLPTVLVTGGGTGSVRLNQIVVDSLPQLLKVANVVHSTGRGKSVDAGNLAGYAQAELITEHMPNVLALADVVVTRAGMGTLTELAALSKPLIIVPMHGTHQDYNARAFSEVSGAPVLDESVLTSAAFSKTVAELLLDDERRVEIGQSLNSTHRPDAADRVAEIVIGLASSKG